MGICPCLQQMLRGLVDFNQSYFSSSTFVKYLFYRLLSVLKPNKKNGIHNLAIQLDNINLSYILCHLSIKIRIKRELQKNHSEPEYDQTSKYIEVLFIFQGNYDQFHTLVIWPPVIISIGFFFYTYRYILAQLKRSRSRNRNVRHFLKNGISEIVSAKYIEAFNRS